MTTHLTVNRTEELTPSLRRVWFDSEDLSAFADSVFTDRYVKLVFLKPGVQYPDPLDVRALRGTMPAEDLPAVRTYTALSPDVEQGTVAIDFVLHGDQGVAGPWAAAAKPGDSLLANGPGGAYRPDPSADWHLLVGDESALPAITAALAELPEDAMGRVVVEVDSPRHRLELSVPAKVEVIFRYRQNDGQTLLDSVRAMDWLPGRVHAFIHGEAQDIMHELRPHLFTERGLNRDQVSISGYWRRGRSEEGFRAWKSELAEREGAAGSGRGRRH